MTKEEFDDHPGWRWCTSEGSREFDRIVDGRMTFREKLEWLEEAETLALRFQAHREKQRAASVRVAETPPPGH